MTKFRPARHLRHAALGIALSLAALPAAAETLTDALIGGYKTSGLLEQNRALLRAADEDVAQSLAQLRPIINYAMSTTYSPNSGGFGQDKLTATAGYTADLLLYDNGASQLAIEAAKQTVLATRQSLISVEQDVLFNAASAFLEVRRAQAFVNLRNSNVNVIQQQLNAANDRFDVGEVTRTDVANAQAALGGARSGLASARGDLEVAREQYKAAVGHYPGELASPPSPPATASSKEAATNVAVRTHPQIKQAQFEVSAAEYNIDRAEAAFGPTLNAQAQVGVDQELDDQASVTLSVSGPVYRGGQLTAAMRQSKARRDASRANLYVAQQNVTQQVGNAWAQLQVAQATISSADQQIRAAQVAFDGTQEEASLGARTTLDVLNAEQDLLNARADRIDAVIQRYTAVYALLRAMGLLTVEHLGLGIPTYDPSAYYNAVRDAPVRDVSPQGQRLDRIIERLRP